MSVTGLTHKQPRVFAHDAVALANLPSCGYKRIDTISLEVLNSGTGFEKDIYNAINSDGSVSFQVDVTAVSSTGQILALDIVDKDCINTSLNIGDLMSVIWAPKGSQSYNDGTSAVDFIIIDSFQTGGDNAAWDYGCPISPIRSPYTSAPSFKNLIKIDCGTCNYTVKPEGAGIYVGYDLSQLTVIMESGTLTSWTNVPAGSFMPVSVLTVCSATAAGPAIDAPTSEELKDYILALF